MRDKLVAAGEVVGVVLFVVGGFVWGLGAGLVAVGLVVFGASRVADS